MTDQTTKSEKPKVKAAFVTRAELIHALEGEYTSKATTARLAAEVFRLRARLKFMGARSAAQPSDFATAFYRGEYEDAQPNALDAAGVPRDPMGRDLVTRIAFVVARLAAVEQARGDDAAAIGRLAVRVDDVNQQLARLAPSERKPADVNAQAREFALAMGQRVGMRPRVPSDEVVRFRLRLVTEEFFELLRATFDDSTSRLAGVVSMEPNLIAEAERTLKTIVNHAAVAVDLPELADACGDLDYVVAGLRAAFGIDGGPIADLIHAANMAKAGGPIRADGKREKPEGWTPPDIAGELQRQGWTDPSACGPSSSPEKAT